MAKHGVEHRFYCSHCTHCANDWIYTFMNWESVLIFNDSNSESSVLLVTVIIIEWKWLIIWWNEQYAFILKIKLSKQNKWNNIQYSKYSEKW